MSQARMNPAGMNHRRGRALNALHLLVAHMSDRNHPDTRPADRFYLLAIIVYAVLAAGFIGFFIWWLVAG